MGKNFFKDGKWTDKLEKTEILTCACSRKYLKTRDAQLTCVSCLTRLKTK